MQQMFAQMWAWVPQIIVALIIWWLGNRLLVWGAALLRRMDIPYTKLDNKAVDMLIKIAMPLGKLILVLIVLDYLGIGRSIISALATGLTLTVAIALGLAFGKALEPEAESVVKEFKRKLKV